MPQARVQRCTQHKWRNLAEHCPPHAGAELKRDWDRIVYADDGPEARQGLPGLRAQVVGVGAAGAPQPRAAGLQLLTFYEFPSSMWKSLRTTNPLENLNREFRRRTKTQGSFATEAAGVTLLWGLIAFAQIRLRRIDSYRDLPRIIAEVDEAAA